MWYPLSLSLSLSVCVYFIYFYFVFLFQGLGFPLHMDSVPPFDLTLDMVVDHLGPSDRPVTFLHHDAKKGFGMTETKAALHVRRF